MSSSFARDLGKEKHEKDYIPSSRVPRDLNMESQGLNYTSSKDPILITNGIRNSAGHADLNMNKWKPVCA